MKEIGEIKHVKIREKLNQESKAYQDKYNTNISLNYQIYSKCLTPYI